MGVRLTELAKGELDSLLESYLKSWGPVVWRHLRALPKEKSPELGLMFKALGAIEADSKRIRKKLAATGADHARQLQDFIIIWLAEEQEHGRALDQMAANCGVHELPPETRKSRHRTVRSIVTWPALYGARAIPGLCATYTTLGSIQELIALKTYRHLAGMCSAPTSDVLKAIAIQESHHMRFYRRSAEIFLRESRKARSVTRRLLDRLWQPPGMDLLGNGNYEKIFGPILNTATYQLGLLEVDRVLGRLPGQEGVKPMSRYLERHGFTQWRQQAL